MEGEGASLKKLTTKRWNAKDCENIRWKIEDKRHSKAFIKTIDRQHMQK